MNKLKRLNKKIAWATVALVLAATAFIASVCYAWFAISDSSEVGGLTPQVVGEGISLVEYVEGEYDGTLTAAPVVAIRHFSEKDTTNGEEIPDQKTVYSVGESNTLELKETYNYTSTDDSTGSSWVKDTSASTETTPLFDSMTPGDYVDITLNFYITDSSLANKTYNIYLENFNNVSSDTIKSTFMLQDSTSAQIGSTVYGTLGAFKYGECSVSDDTVTAPTSTTFFRSFSEYEGDSPTADSELSVNVASGTFGDVGSKNAVSVTFRIAADFEQYYALLQEKNAVDDSDSGGSGDYTIFGKVMTVGIIRISPEE